MTGSSCGWWLVSGQPEHDQDCATCRASAGGPDHTRRAAAGLDRLAGESDRHWAWRLRRADREAAQQHSSTRSDDHAPAAGM